jgi:hypothetical protein
VSEPDEKKFGFLENKSDENVEEAIIALQHLKGPEDI